MDVPLALNDIETRQGFQDYNIKSLNASSQIGVEGFYVLGICMCGDSICGSADISGW